MPPTSHQSAPFLLMKNIDGLDKITPSAGIFGDLPGRYQLSLDVGGRYFFLRKMDFSRKRSG